MTSEHLKTTIIIGDSRRMDELRDESIHLIITSPPYWQLKDYGNGSQIGFNDSYEDYINNLNLVWKECYRVLHKGCRLCVNIGDQFARSVYYGRYKVIPIREEIIKFCETIGFDYMGAIIWQKVTTCNTTGGATIMGSFPYPRNGIIKLDYEFILIFRKLGDSPKVSRDIREKSKLTIEEWNEYFYGHWNFSGERQDKHLAMFPEELPKRLIKMFSFVGDTVLDPFLGSGTTCLAAKNLGRNSVGYEINEDFLPTIKEKLNIRPSASKNLKDVIPACRSRMLSGLKKDAGQAGMTKQMFHRPAKEFISKTTFSSFHGLTGPECFRDRKTLDARLKTSGRTYKDVVYAVTNDRISNCRSINKQHADIEIIIQQKKDIDFKKEIYALPYIFKDPVRFDKKIDPKKLRFGSRIDNEDSQRETYYSVKDVVSPEILILDNDLRVRLIGVKEIKSFNGEALQFLNKKLRGEKVFLKFDALKHDEKGNLLCYLYLKNKTFINAHLIRNKLAQVDTSHNFKYKSKFIGLQNNKETVR
jgi:DNA modification methylase